MIRFVHSAIMAIATMSLLPSPAHADVAGMRAAIDAMDVAGLQREAASESEAARTLASALEGSWTRHDAGAASALASAVDAQSDRSLKAAGLRALMSLYLRRGEFAAAAETGAASAVFEPLSPGEQQALTFVTALVGVSPTRAIGNPSGSVPIMRDLAGLIRSDIAVGAESIAAILDTGANFSTISETSAQRLGLRMLDSNVSVGSTSRDAVASRLGVAERLSIGGSAFSNVVFIVLPDADLSFADGAYTIDAILGMPVFLEMKRIEVARVDDGEVFRFGDQSTGVGTTGRNILFNALSPMAELSIDVKGNPVQLFMLLDSGAQKTSFEGAFGEHAASLLADAATVTSTRGGAGGMVTSDTTRRIAEVRLRLGNSDITLADVDFHESSRERAHGILGLDAMKRGFVIDWDKGVVVAVNDVPQDQ